jgi:hypothetical protein
MIISHYTMNSTILTYREVCEMESSGDSSVRISRVVLRNVKINDVRVRKSHYKDFRLSPNITEPELAYLKSQIKLHLGFTKLNTSNIKCTNSTEYDEICMIDGNITVKYPIVHQGILTPKDVKLADLVTTVNDPIYFKGIFDLTLAVAITRDNDELKSLWCTIERMNLSEDYQMRYMGDCVFPDMFICAGEDSVDINYLNKFMETY